MLRLTPDLPTERQTASKSAHTQAGFDSAFDCINLASSTALHQAMTIQCLKLINAGIWLALLGFFSTSTFAMTVGVLLIAASAASLMLALVSRA